MIGHLKAPVVVAIPAKDEADRIGPCLGALAAQRGVDPPEVVVLLNNCTDATESVVHAIAACVPNRVHAAVRDLPAGLASAGLARSLAMECADALVADDGVLLTTDADSVAPPDWIATNLAALRAADAVAGRAVIDPYEARLIPDALHEDDARECTYAALLDEIASLLDPDPADPWPRHDEHSGASIAVRVPAFRSVGGIPALPLGEDRAFFAALRRHDMRIRHAPEVWVSVSGRVVGRALGGMADTIRRRMTAPDLMIDDRLETVEAAARRASLRHLARQVQAGVAPGPLAAALRLSRGRVADILGSRTFGAAWADLESKSPVLRWQRMPVSALAEQTRQATALCCSLRRNARFLMPAGADPGDISAPAATDADAAMAPSTA